MLKLGLIYSLGLTGLALFAIAVFSPRIDPVRLANDIALGGDYHIVDVRTHTEFGDGHLPSAEHVPFWQIFQHRQYWSKPGPTVVIYCAHGPRAWLASVPFWLSGRDFRLLDGHLSGWLALQLPIDQPNATSAAAAASSIQGQIEPQRYNPWLTTRF